MVMKLLNAACLTFSSHFANRIRTEVLSFVLLNIQDRFWHSLHAFSKSGYFLKSISALFDWFSVHLRLDLYHKYLLLASSCFSVSPLDSSSEVYFTDLFLALSLRHFQRLTLPICA
jgi:hypothetical protein